MKNAKKSSKKVTSKSAPSHTAKSASKPEVTAAETIANPSAASPAAESPSPARVTPPAALIAQAGSQDPGAPAPVGAVVPKPPTDWKPVKVGRGKGARGRQAQISNAALAAKELTSPTYAQDFGPHAPSQARLAHLVGEAAAWRKQWVSSKRWAAYTAEQNASWWEAALASASLLQPAFDYAVARDPSLIDKYPATTQFMQAGSVIGKRAAMVRKARTTANGDAPKAKGGAKARANASAVPSVPEAPPEPATEAVVTPAGTTASAAAK